MKWTHIPAVSALLAALLVAAPAAAQLYKWVDENGVTNYSNTPPDDPGLARKLLPVVDRVSVYTTDPALDAEIQRFRARALSPAPADPPQVRPGPAASVIGVPGPVLSDPCAGPYGCPGRYVEHHPYVFVPVLPAHRRIPRLHPAQIPPGTIAGHATGSMGFIPGNSASAPASGLASRPGRVYLER